jgi:putative peptidoglycan lipid II flippase
VATSAAVRSAQAGITTGVGFTPFTSAYYIMLLPYSIVTISIVTALLPHLSKLAIEKNVTEVKKQLIRAIRMCGVVTVPSSVALLLFGSLMTEVLYFGISLQDSRYIGYVLSALSLGLVAFSINLILIRGFNAFEDTKTQVISILIINIISSALSYLFLATVKSDHVTIGLGLAFAVSYIIGLFVTISLLSKHVGKFEYSHFMGQHLRLYFASFLSMLPFFALAYFLGWNNDDAKPLIGVLRLAFVLAGGGAGFLFIAHALKITEIATLKEFAISLLSKRKSARKR